MKYYTDIIPLPLAEKLKEKGMPIRYEQTDKGVRPTITFGACFDWLELNGIGLSINHCWSGTVYQGFVWRVCRFYKTETPYFDTTYDTWHEAAEAAIEKALILI